MSNSFVLSLAIAAGAIAGSSAGAQVLEDSKGSRSGRLEFHQDQVISDGSPLLFDLGRFKFVRNGGGEINGLTLPTKGSNFPVSGFDQISTEVLGCSLGTQKVPVPSIDLLLNGRSAITVAEAENSFALSLRMTMPRNAAGTFSCSVARLIRAPGNESLIAIDLVVHFVESPEWQDLMSRPVRDIYFDFSSNVNSSQGSTDVLSNVVQVKLTHVQAVSAGVEVHSPRECSIGTWNVAAQHIRLEVNQGPMAECQCVTIRPDVPISMRLIFDKAGSYNRYHGLVGCKHPGEMVYTY